MVNEIILVGTGHVFNIQNSIHYLIHKYNPSIIAVELDLQRARSFLSNKKRGIQNQNFLYNLLAKAQKRIAKKFDTQPGQEMVTAIKTAHSMNIPVAAIDMNADLIMKKIWRALTLKRKIQLFSSVFLSFFIDKKSIEQEISKFESNAEEQLKLLEDKMPEIKHVLLDERNEYMAKNIILMAAKHEKVMVFVGEGHILGLSKLLKKEIIQLEIIHLKQLLSDT